MATEIDNRSTDRILRLTFNQDSTGLTVGTMNGYACFSLTKSEGTDLYEIEIVRPPAYFRCTQVRIIERLFQSSLLAIVKENEPRNMKLIHFRRGSLIYSRRFPRSILAIKLNRTRILVCFEESILLYNIWDMTVLHQISDLPLNPDGIYALSPDENSPYLAYPDSSTEGDVQIFNTDLFEKGILISAHESPLVAMAFDAKGLNIATASKENDVIRIHHSMTGICLFEYKPEVLRNVMVYSFAFSPRSDFLAAAFNTGETYIFKINSGSTVDRPFATVNLQSSNKKIEIAINSSTNDSLFLFVSDYDDIHSIYRIDSGCGGECELLYRTNLLDSLRNSLEE